MHDSPVAWPTDAGQVVRVVRDTAESDEARWPDALHVLGRLRWDGVDGTVVPHLADPPRFLGGDSIVDDPLLPTNRPVPPFSRKWHNSNPFRSAANAA